MPRLPRVHLEGVLYYVTARAIAGQPLFQDDRDYEVYRALLEHYRQRYGFTLFAYCLLPDHLHLCLELSPSGTISAIMHDLTTRYTKYVNKRHARNGHLFQDRFRSVIVEKSEHLLPLTAYLHRHPQRSGVVTDIAAYRFSSYPHYLSAGQWASGPDMSDAILEALTQLPPEHAEGGYAQYVTQLSAQDLDALRGNLRRRILGSEPFVEMIRSRLQAGREIPTSEPQEPMPVARTRRAFRSPAWSMAAAGVALALGLSALAIRQMAGSGRTLVLISPGNRTTLPARVAMAVHSELAEEVAVLQGSEWDIQVIPVHGPAASAPQSDRLTFTQTQVFSKALTAKGYPSSKYLVSRQPDGRLVWETIQTNRKGDIISWQGEWQGTVMRGVMTRQPAGKSSEPFTFVGVLKSSDAVRSET